MPCPDRFDEQGLSQPHACNDKFERHFRAVPAEPGTMVRVKVIGRGLPIDLKNRANRYRICARVSGVSADLRHEAGLIPDAV